MYVSIQVFILLAFVGGIIGGLMSISPKLPISKKMGFILGFTGSVMGLFIFSNLGISGIFLGAFLLTLIVGLLVSSKDV